MSNTDERPERAHNNDTTPVPPQAAPDSEFPYGLGALPDPVCEDDRFITPEELQQLRPFSEPLSEGEPQARETQPGQPIEPDLRAQCLQALFAAGLPGDGDYWWLEAPERAVTDLLGMSEATNAESIVAGQLLVWDEAITTRTGREFQLMMIAGPGYPKCPVSALARESESGKLHVITPHPLSQLSGMVTARQNVCAEIEHLASPPPGEIERRLQHHHEAE